MYIILIVCVGGIKKIQSLNKNHMIIPKQILKTSVFFKPTTTHVYKIFFYKVHFA